MDEVDGMSSGDKGGMSELISFINPNKGLRKNKKKPLQYNNPIICISNEDFDDLSLHGFSEDDIWDIAGITAFFGLSNRMANFTSMRANTEFYKMGR